MPPLSKAFSIALSTLSTIIHNAALINLYKLYFIKIQKHNKEHDMYNICKDKQFIFHPIKLM